MTSSTFSSTSNEALAPVAAQARVFAWRDHASLWFSLGVGLPVMQMGAYLLPALSPREALAAMSAHSVLPAWSIRRWGLLVAALCTVLALVLPMRSLEPFLLFLSSCFVPLFSVMLGRLAFGANAQELMRSAPAVRWGAVAI